MGLPLSPKMVLAWPGLARGESAVTPGDDGSSASLSSSQAGGKRSTKPRSSKPCRSWGKEKMGIAAVVEEKSRGTGPRIAVIATGRIHKLPFKTAARHLPGGRLRGTSLFLRGCFLWTPRRPGSLDRDRFP